MTLMTFHMEAHWLANSSVFFFCSAFSAMSIFPRTLFVHTPKYFFIEIWGFLYYLSKFKWNSKCSTNFRNFHFAINNYAYDSNRYLLRFQFHCDFASSAQRAKFFPPIAKCSSCYLFCSIYRSPQWANDN